jgi:hypothetical protein
MAFAMIITTSGVTLFINGQPLYNLVDPDALQQLINAELTRQGVKPPPPMQPQH